MDILGIIPARGGSKGIPRKNLALLAGRPLIAYTCEAARSSPGLRTTIVSTDDPEIASVAERHGVNAPFLRPANLAGDQTPMVDVVIHAVEWFEQHGSFAPQAIALLQPTSPLRRAGRVDAAIDLMRAHGADTVVSVVPVPHAFNPVSVLKKTPEGAVEPFWDGPLILRRQDKPEVWARNGPALLLVKREVLHQGTLYGERIWPLEMSAAESVDVDGPEDLALAEYWLARRSGGAPPG